MFFIAYTFKGQVHDIVFAGQVKIVSHSSCRTSTILKYFCPLTMNASCQNLLVSATKVKIRNIFGCKIKKNISSSSELLSNNSLFGSQL